MGAGDDDTRPPVRHRGWQGQLVRTPTRTVALSWKAWVEPSKVEALPRIRHQRSTRTTRSCPDRLRLSARVEVIGPGNRSMQQCLPAHKRVSSPMALEGCGRPGHESRRGLARSSRAATNRTTGWLQPGIPAGRHAPPGPRGLRYRPITTRIACSRCRAPSSRVAGISGLRRAGRDGWRAGRRGGRAGTGGAVAVGERRRAVAGRRRSVAAVVADQARGDPGPHIPPRRSEDQSRDGT